MEVTIVDNGGDGVLHTLTVEEGESVAEVFRRAVSEGNFSDYIVRVNGQEHPRNDAVEDGDRITITPKGVKGAA